MACGCKNKQAQTAPKNENVNRAKPATNGARAIRREKRIIR